MYWKKHWTARHRQRHHSNTERMTKHQTLRYVTSAENIYRTWQRDDAGRIRDDKYMTTIEAADCLCLTVCTLKGMRVEGTGPRFLKAGPGLRARVLYRQSDLEAWLAGYCIDSTSEYEG